MEENNKVNVEINKIEKRKKSTISKVCYLEKSTKLNTFY